MQVLRYSFSRSNDLGTKKTSYLPQHPQHLMMRWGKDNCKRYSCSKKRGWEVHSSHCSIATLHLRFPDSRDSEILLGSLFCSLGVTFLIHGCPLLLALPSGFPALFSDKSLFLLEITDIYSWIAFSVCFLFIESWRDTEASSKSELPLSLLDPLV